MLTRCSLLLLLAVVTVMAACGGSRPGLRLQELPPEAAVECPPAGRADGTAPLIMAFPGRLEPSRAPLPASEVERHVFAALYEPLVRVDCRGRLQPALATSWTSADGGRTWTFELREGARFWTGEPVTPEAVARSWRRAEALCRLRGEPSPLLDVGAFGPGGPGIFEVRLPDADLSRLAHPALAVVGPADGRGWLSGSGPCRAQGRTLLPTAGHPLAPSWPSLDLADPTDLRDALDQGAQAVVIRDRQVQEYYAGRPGVVMLDLPWDRWYYLVTPAGERRWAEGWDRRELANEVAGIVARPAEFTAYEPPPGSVGGLTPRVEIRSAPGLAGEELILWPESDPTAGRLAARLTTLAGRPLRSTNTNPGRGTLTPPPLPWQPTSRSVADATVIAHVQEAQVGAVVMPWPRRAPRAEDELTRLLSLGQWLQDAARDDGLDSGAVPPGARPARFLDAAPPAPAVAAMRRLERDRRVQPLIRSRAILVSDPAVQGWAWDILGTLQLWTVARQP